MAPFPFPTPLAPVKLGVSYDLSTTPPDVPSDPQSTDNLEQYSYGLNGVNTGMDNQSSQVLYVAIGIIFIAITILRLLQRSNAHLRQLTTYGSKDRQLYWTRDLSGTWAFIKRHIIYAPLRSVRHNKEIQLSKAVNIGTLPGRLHFVLLFLFVVSQLTFMTILDYNRPWEASMAELRGRSGHLAVLNMIALFVMAGRNNPFIRVLRVSFDTFNLFHRWIGRIIVIESLIHTAAWAAVKVKVSGWEECQQSLVEAPFLVWGLVGTIALTCILLHSPSPIRHAFYETFLCIHQLLAFVVVLGVFYHAKAGALPQYCFVVGIVMIWSYDRLFRLARIFYYNFSWKHGWTKVIVEALPGEACRVTFHTGRAFTPRPGSHVYAYLPTVTWWQSHPFSVAWTSSADSMQTTLNGDIEKNIIVRNDRTTVSLIISARSGMTKNLYNKAMLSPNKQLIITGFLEGPYGSLESLHSYGTALLFAGGVGITHHLPHIRDLIQGYTEKTTSTQKVTLVWTIRDENALEWVRPWMDEILAMPCRREMLNIKIFVTRPSKTLRDGSARVQVIAGRPKIQDLVDAEFDKRIGAMVVGVCGPGAYADDVRAAARQVVDQGKVDFFEEGFTW